MKTVSEQMKGFLERMVRFHEEQEAALMNTGTSTLCTQGSLMATRGALSHLIHIQELDDIIKGIEK